jgi:hypothetical protein
MHASLNVLNSFASTCGFSFCHSTKLNQHFLHSIIMITQGQNELCNKCIKCTQTCAPPHSSILQDLMVDALNIVFNL